MLSEPDRGGAARRVDAVAHHATAAADGAAVAMAGAADAARGIADGLGGPNHIGAAAAAADQLGKQFQVVAEQFAALADVLRDVHGVARDRIADLADDYLDDFLANVPRHDDQPLAPHVDDGDLGPRSE